MKPAGYVLLVLLLLSFFAVDAFVSSSGEEYSRYNTNWNGTSLFVGDALSGGAVLVSDYETLPETGHSTLILIEPDGAYSPEELRTLRNYKLNGNTIIISDEEGLSAPLLKVFGTDLSVEKARLMSVDKEYDDPGFIICYTVNEDLKNTAGQMPNENLTETTAPLSRMENGVPLLNGSRMQTEGPLPETGRMPPTDPLLNGVTSIVLNKPSVATGGNDLITTSFMSWVDTNDNGKADNYESIGKRSVFVTADTVYLLSDSGIFLNAVYKDEQLKDNRKFIRNMLTTSDTVYLDVAHSPIASEEGMVPLVSWLRTSEMAKAVAIIIILFLLLFIYRDKNDR